MQNLISRISYGQLPDWAHPQHPIMRTILSGKRGTTIQRWLQRLALIAAAIGAAVGLGYAIVSDDPETANDLREALYWPIVVAQLAAMLAAIGLTTNAVIIERRRQTWDSLKLTVTGVPLTLRARWIAVFYKLGWLLAIITAMRLIYLGLLLDDILAFRGRALDLRITGIEPQPSLDLTVVLMAAFMTSFIMQPFVAVGLAAAIGLVVSVGVRTRSFLILGVLLLFALRLATTLGGLITHNTILETDFSVRPELADLTSLDAIGRLLYASTEGDMLLKVANLDTLGQLWADADYSIYLGGFLLLVTAAQALIANVVVVIAAWAANKPTYD